MFGQLPQVFSKEASSVVNQTAACFLQRIEYVTLGPRKQDPQNCLRETTQGQPMKSNHLLFSALIGAVASARSMTPMASIAAAGLLGHRTPGRLLLLDRPLFKYGALAMGAGELMGDKVSRAVGKGSQRGHRRRCTGTAWTRTSRSAHGHCYGGAAGLPDPCGAQKRH